MLGTRQPPHVVNTRSQLRDYGCMALILLQWSFSTTGALEGAYQIATGSLRSLSEQQLIDCSTTFGNQGCSGGSMRSEWL